VRLVVEVAVWQAEPALLDEAEVALLDQEHVEVVTEPARSVQLPAGRGHPVEPVPAAQVLRRLCLALDELEDEDGAVREIRDHPGADSRVRRRDRVVVLVLPVDREEARVFRGHADDVRPAVGLDLVVRVREAAGELGHGVRALQLGYELEDFFDLCAAAFHVA
jgi:hypothetical protein